MIRQFLSLTRLLCLVTALDLQASGETKKPPGSLDLATLQLQIREEAVSLREEMNSMLGGGQNTLSWVVRDLVQEVRGYKDLVSEQGKTVEDLMTKHAEEMEEVKMDLKKTLDQLDGLKSRMDVMRSEVRLISQHKLTWQNSTLSDRYHSDFLVDGVYRMINDESGMNPIQHTADNQVGPNMMVMIDLGARFKIHTVKLWKRTSTCCDGRFPGLLIYADDTLVGVTTGVKYLYNILVSGEVYATKIYVKQPATITVNFLEIQVFGTGPFGDEEI